MTTQTPSSSPTPAPRTHPLTGYPAAFLLITLSFFLGLLASTHISATFDEGIHLAGGYIHYTLGQPRIHTENGYLSQAIAAFPFLLTHPNLPDQSSTAFLQADPFLLGQHFLYHANNNPAQLLLLSRAMIGLLTSLTAITIYTWSRKLFSPLAGMLSVLLFSFAPLTLAHGFLATSDMPASCFFLLATAAFWHTLQKITPLRLLLSYLALAALFLSKMSAPIILPVLVILLIINHLSRPLPRSAFSVQRSVFLLLTHALAVYILIWAAYGFTYSAFKDSPPTTSPASASTQTLWPPDNWHWALSHPNTILNTIAFAKNHHLLPEAYLYGYAYVTQTSMIALSTINFAVEQYTIGSWWWFFPYVFLITTPIPILLLMTLLVALLLKRFLLRPKCAPSTSENSAPSLCSKLYPLTPLLSLLILYWLASILSYRSTGPRHLLPAYPPLCILLGSLALFLPTSLPNLKQKPLLPLTTFTLFASLFLTTILSFPNYIPSFNLLMGGPPNAFHHLVDSAVDWGQSLPALSKYLDTNNTTHEPVYLSYFGSADPNFYLQSNALPSLIQRPEETTAALSPLQPGYYCISVTMLQSLYSLQTKFDGPYTPDREKDYQSLLQDAQHVAYLNAHPELANTLTQQDRDRIAATPQLLRAIEFVRLCAALRDTTPTAQAGFSINIYHLSQSDLDHALHGPPPYDP